MNELAQRLKAYIEAHPFDPGDSECETILDQLYQACAESHESDPRRSEADSKNWMTSWATYPWMITMPCGTSVVNSAPPMSIKHLSMVSNTVRT